MVQNRHTFADAAYVFLRENDGELHYKDLARQVLDAGYFVSRGKTPEQTLRSQISREIKQTGDEARFVNKGQGILALSDHGRAEPPGELVEAVHDFAERRKKKAAKKAAKKPADKPAEAAPAVAPEPKAAPVAAEPPTPVPPVAAEAPIETPKAAAAPAVSAEDDPDITGTGGAFIPVDLGEDLDYVDLDDAAADGTFASPEQDVGLLEDPEDEEAEAVVVGPKARDEDDEKDFLSVGQDLRDMKSNEYHASMDELAPIVVPPHEGGAAEIARLPMGGRSVLIIKIVRRHGRPQIQLVEELESLISGVVGRLLLTLPGEDLSDMLEAMLICRKVISESFIGGEDEVHEAVYVD